jgi:hypothetical protein
MALRCALALPLNPATGGNSICIHVFIFSSTEKAVPLHVPLPLADTVALPLSCILELTSYQVYNTGLQFSFMDFITF